MTWLLLIFYFILLLWFTKRFIVGKLAFSTAKTWLFFASIKMMAGILYVYAHSELIKGGDLHAYFDDGCRIFQELGVDPYNYLRLVFGPNNMSTIPKGLEKAVEDMGFWWDSGAYMLVRINALIRVISFGNIYIHGLLAGFLSFLGCIGLVKVLYKHMNIDDITLYTVFIFPSLLFWTSGLHKEFVSVFSLGWLYYGCISIIGREKVFRNIIIVLFAGLILFFTRPFLLFLFLPNIAIYYFVRRLNTPPILSFSLIYILLFVLLSFIKVPFINQTALEIVFAKQELFNVLKNGNTAIEINDAGSFVELLLSIPVSLFNTVVRPHYGDINNLPLFLAGIENVFILSIFIAGLLWVKDLPKTNRAIFSLFFFYGLSYLIIIGWIVPNIGAILRYRSVALFFMLPVLIQSINNRRKLNKV